MEAIIARGTCFEDANYNVKQAAVTTLSYVMLEDDQSTVNAVIARCNHPNIIGLGLASYLN